ncbi:MAG: cyclophilin-like fold protein [Thermodesulfobacteriota bacterium]
MEIIIEAGRVRAEAELDDTATARDLFATLPVRNEVSTWGEEIYFEVPVDRGLDETARELVQEGDLGYWPTGKAFCIFFGPTPVSGPGEIRPASAVNVIGRIRGEAAVFRKVPDGAEVLIRRK